MEQYYCAVGSTDREILMIDTPKMTAPEKEAYLYLRDKASVMLRPYLKQLASGAKMPDPSLQNKTYTKRLLKKDVQVTS
jgi:hypothetical protein